MKKFAQTAVLIAGLAGLSACAGNGTMNQNTVPYGNRTAGQGTMVNVDEDAPILSSGALASCQERARRLEDMNRSCYRK